MDGRDFDNLVRQVASGNRRSFLNGVAAALLANFLGTTKANARSQGLVVLGGACASSEECQPGCCPVCSPTPCAENGFTSDGPLNCCSDVHGPCTSDADCCGDLRCSWGEFCNHCEQPPIPTRFISQLCLFDTDCVPLLSGSAVSRCVEGRCKCIGPENVCAGFDSTELEEIPDTESGLAAAEALSALEVAGQFDTLYDQMHPDARQIVPREVVVGWYEEDFAPLGLEAAEAIKVRIAPWKWAVNGETYPETAEVAYRQRDADGPEERSEVRLVKNLDGNWSWFFGRDRDFVEKQIARFSPTG